MGRRLRGGSRRGSVFDRTDSAEDPDSPSSGVPARATPTVAERQSSMSEPAMLADHLDQQTDAILAVWRATVDRGGDVPESERLSYGEFLDHVPALLDRLAERLRGQPSDAVAEGKEHGKHRWR